MEEEEDNQLFRNELNYWKFECVTFMFLREFDMCMLMSLFFWYVIFDDQMIITRNFSFQNDQKTTHTTMWSKYYQENNLNSFAPPHQGTQNNLMRLWKKQCWDNKKLRTSFLRRVNDDDSVWINCTNYFYGGFRPFRILGYLFTQTLTAHHRTSEVLSSFLRERFLVQLFAVWTGVFLQSWNSPRNVILIGRFQDFF